MDLAVAIVTREEFDMGKLSQDLLKELGTHLAPVMVFKIDAIPRNPMGKVQRFALTTFFNKQLAKKSAD